MQGIKPSWTPPSPPKCPRILVQTLPRRPGRPRANQKGYKLQRKRVCPPMQLIHPGVITCLLAEAPRHSSASRMPSGGGDGALRVPRVLCPLAPLDRIELPQRGIFGPTLPVPTVGRSDEDGGMPRSISPYRAWVVPPLSLSAACTGRIAAAVCASPGLAQTPEPPRIVVVPTGDLKAPMELVEEAMAVFGFPEGLSSWFAAAFDLPCARHISGGPLAIKPLRVDAPLPISGAHPETGRNDEGAWTNNCGMLPKFGNAPTLEFTEAMYDVPQSVLRPVLPPDAAPYVPTAPELLLGVWMSAGMAAVASDPPYVVAGTDEAASLAFEHVATDFPRVDVSARPPQPIKRQLVMSRSFYTTRTAAHGHTAESSAQTLPTNAGEHLSGKGNLKLPEEGRPTWRDWSSQGDEAAHSLDSFGPVWHDSDELLETEPDTPPTPYPWAGGQKSPDRSLPSLATRRLPTKNAGSCSVFSLDPTLGRRRTQSSTRVPGKLPTKHKAPSCDGKTRTKTGSSRRKRTPGAAVWKDALEVPQGILVVPERTLTIGADAEGPSGTIVHGFSRYQQETQDSAQTAHGGPVPVRSPARREKSESPPLRRMMHPLRARKVGRGARSKSLLTFDDALPIVVQHRPRGGHAAQTRSRLFGNGSFLSLASSSTAVWKSIASIPEDPPPPPRPRVSGLPRRKGRESVDQRRTLLSEGRGNVVVSPRVPPGLWRTPPFS